MDGWHGMEGRMDTLCHRYTTITFIMPFLQCNTEKDHIYLQSKIGQTSFVNQFDKKAAVLTTMPNPSLSCWPNFCFTSSSTMKKGLSSIHSNTNLKIQPAVETL